MANDFERSWASWMKHQNNLRSKDNWFDRLVWKPVWFKNRNSTEYKLFKTVCETFYFRGKISALKHFDSVLSKATKK